MMQELLFREKENSLPQNISEVLSVVAQSSHLMLLQHSGWEIKALSIATLSKCFTLKLSTNTPTYF